ncbi:hypothetical protein [Thiothrix lacustris]|uniref:hypothetical protein n=1 Tax=Thiothrix lacustris TaxID=525917 RepID=UPI0027E481E9|nr:hypothetical protein [Thiothrix lacustris]WMP18737.1 hypothetical protein RCS87_06675 [Thiothrix lacustris]
MNIKLKTLLLSTVMALALNGVAQAETVNMKDGAMDTAKDKVTEVSGKQDTAQQAAPATQAAPTKHAKTAAPVKHKAAKKAKKAKKAKHSAKMHKKAAKKAAKKATTPVVK